MSYLIYRLYQANFYKVIQDATEKLELEGGDMASIDDFLEVILVEDDNPNHRVRQLCHKYYGDDCGLTIKQKYIFN